MRFNPYFKSAANFRFGHLPSFVLSVAGLAACASVYQEVAPVAPCAVVQVTAASPSGLRQGYDRQADPTQWLFQEPPAESKCLGGETQNNGVIIECQHPGDLTAALVDEKLVISIKGNGIGNAKVSAAHWPQVVMLRVYLGGLESLSLTNENETLKLAVLSHSGHSTLIHLWKNGKEGNQLEKSNPYWTEVRRMNPNAKPCDGLPPKGGWFELQIPKAILTNSKELQLSWIDFYR